MRNRIEVHHVQCMDSFNNHNEKSFRFSHCKDAYLPLGLAMFMTELEKARTVAPLKATLVTEGVKAEVAANIVVAIKAVVFIFRRSKTFLFKNSEI